ncbi:MAG: hypothetical protein L3J63_04085 [Geopsychrobacter sp.]|nr:hypothetical protein [Geopsychrobacter sp.]
MKHFLLLLLILCPSFAEAQITQRDWALQLIDSLGWSFGLPEKPTDDDYARMLDGNRVYRVEAEEAYQRGDRVAVMQFKTFGEFSGDGWLNGIKNRTQAHLKFNLPHAGRYKVRARVRLREHHLLIGGRDFRMSGSNQFTDVEVGYVEMQSGEQEAVVQLRPNGSIDYIELEAEPFAPIRPAGGWNFDAALTPEVAARTTIQSLNLQNQLPLTAQSLNLEAENLVQPAGVRIYRGSNKGEASGGRYVQVGAAPVELNFYAVNLADGVKDLVLRAASGKVLRVKFEGYLESQVRFDSRFTDRVLGTFFVPQGDMSIRVQLPAGASVDRLELRSRRAGRQEMLKLVGLKDSAKVKPRDLNNLSALIYRLKALR